ncbi:MAG: helix-turn-helix transcriptional regulator [bacterium]|nr:helix-turn-helix transcriptional regulator [bacterium]
MYMDLDNAFSRLKNMREDLELTQKEIAKILDVKRSTYAGWECGKDIIPLRQLNKLSNYYNISIDYLLGFSNTKFYNPINYEINSMEVSKKLKEIRESLQLTQAEFAEVVGFSQSNCHKYESNKALITTSYISNIAKRYGISIDWILSKTKNRNIS